MRKGNHVRRARAIKCKVFVSRIHEASLRWEYHLVHLGLTLHLQCKYHIIQGPFRFMVHLGVLHVHCQNFAQIKNVKMSRKTVKSVI